MSNLKQMKVNEKSSHLHATTILKHYLNKAPLRHSFKGPCCPLASVGGTAINMGASLLIMLSYRSFFKLLWVIITASCLEHQKLTKTINILTNALLILKARTRSTWWKGIETGYLHMCTSTCISVHVGATGGLLRDNVGSDTSCTPTIRSRCCGGWTGPRRAMFN